MSAKGRSLQAAALSFWPVRILEHGLSGEVSRLTLIIFYSCPVRDYPASPCREFCLRRDGGVFGVVRAKAVHRAEFKRRADAGAARLSGGPTEVECIGGDRDGLRLQG